jgi:H+/Cl- antiporter ClcA
MVEAANTGGDPASIMRDRRFVALLVLAAIVGVVASLAAWGFLEGLHEIQDGVFDDLPDALGYDSAPIWWPLPWLAVAGVVVAFAIVRLPGRGGHVPADGLNATPSQPIEVPGVLLAAFAGIGLGIVLGPEAPLIALGGGLGFLAVRMLRAGAPDQLQSLVAVSGIFAALSFLFGSPVIAAVILIEASGLGGSRLPLVLVPGLMAAGIGSLVSIGMGAWTGVSTDEISLSLLQMPDYARPDIVDFLWTVPLAAAIPVGTFVIFRIGRLVARYAASRPFLLLPAAGLAVAGLAIGFSEATDKGVEEVLFSGQDQLGPLVANAGTWSLGALALLIVCKGIAYGLALGSFRGGPVFPALFLGAAAGLMAAQLPGFSLTPAVAVGLGAAVASVLRLPLSAVVLATLLTSQAGLGPGPLIIVGVVVAYLVAMALPDLHTETPSPEGAGGETAPPASL